MAEIFIHDLTKTYQDADRQLRVINGLTYTFKGGKSYAILGKSGIGKSTLLQLIGGLDTPTSGTVSLGGTDITQLSDDDRARFRGSQVGFVFQFHHLLPEFSAQENVAMPLHAIGQGWKMALEQAEQLLRQVGLGERLNHRPGQLSGGEQQRVAIARALVHKPKVLLADEPTGNLDVMTSREVRELLLSLHKSCGCTVIIVTHSEEFAGYLEEILVMEPGGTLVPFGEEREIASM
jgi:lipoprotein-releasing system ATP-binding protein